MCVHMESLPCSRTSPAPNGRWNLAVKVVRDLAVPTSFPASAMFYVDALSSKQTVFLAYLAHTLGLYPLFLPPGMSSPNPLPSFSGFKTAPSPGLHKLVPLHLEANPDGPTQPGTPLPPAFPPAPR